MKKSITVNFVYNMLYQVLVTALPILTTPYIARVLGLHANGIHSYTEGIVTYFMLLGGLGTALYGTRKIAYERNNPEKMTKSTWEIIILRFLLFGVTLAVFVVSLCIKGEYAYLYRIQIINVLANAIDISWFFQGVEDFKSVTLRNLFVKIVYVVCLFVFIKEPNDLQWYVFLIVGSSFIGNLWMWVYLKRYLINDVVKKPIELLCHLKGSIALFIPQITNYVYALLDRSMLKWLTGSTDNVGIYDQAQRLVRAITAILQSLGYVMLARIANLSSEKDEQGIRIYIRKSMNFTLFLAFPMMFGLAGTAKDFIPIFLGKEYLDVIPVLQMLSILVLTMSLNSVLGVQLLISVGKENKYAIATSTGAIINVLINLILIPQCGVIGACISSIIAECMVFTISFINAREYLNLKEIIKDNTIPFLTSAIMCFGLIAMQTVEIAIPLRLVLEVVMGGGFYFIVMLITRNEIMYLILSKLTRKG